MTRSWIWLVGLLAGCASGQVTPGGLSDVGAEVHVVPDAVEDDPDGSEAHPFANLYDAIDRIGDTRCEIVMHAGRHVLTRDVEIPDGADLRILPGTTLALGPRALFVVSRVVTAVGTEVDPITLTWLFEDQPWGSVFLWRPESNGSVFEHVIVEHGSFGQWHGKGFTGALSIFDAEARVTSCTFRDNTGDDSVNIKRAFGIVEDCTFFGGLDGIDFDENDGEISHNTLTGTGNDGIDMGYGATPLVHFNTVIGSADKCVSIGEGAAPTVEHNLLVGCDLGVGIKDSSEPLVRHDTIVGNRVGVIAYQGVADMGGGRGVVEDCIVWGSTDDDVQLHDDSSTIFRWNAIEDGWVGEGNLDASAGEPFFADAAAGDFHLRSVAGRWDPAARAFVEDAETSPFIDAADPAADYSGETSPAGGRANLGAEGNTPQASRSAEGK